MKSGYWVAIGAIFIPSAMVWVLEAPTDWHPLLVWVPAIIFTVLGIDYLRKGWLDIADEGKLRRKEKSEIDKKENQRRKESRAVLMVLCYISRRRPISVRMVDRILQRWAEEEEMTELLKGDAINDDEY